MVDNPVTNDSQAISQNAMRRPDKRSGLVVMRILGRKAYSLRLPRMKLASPMLSFTICRQYVVTTSGTTVGTN